MQQTPSQISRCATCGSPIDTASAGDLGCIACLLNSGLETEAEQDDVASGLAPDQLGAYTIEHHRDGSVWELGHGAMGVTYRAVDKALDRPVALKIINADRGSHSAEARERFMREARAAAALRHPNVATVYQFGVREETGQFFYAMELVEGETLQERVRRLGPLDVLSTIDIALQVTAALEAAEKRRLVHRDLKPGNLMLVNAAESEVAQTSQSAVSRVSKPAASANSCAWPIWKSAIQLVWKPALRRRAWRARGANSCVTVKVIDFGVAKAISEKTDPKTLTHSGFVGTPAFASPEQFTNASVDVRSDIYSLGATLWFLLTGHILFSGHTTEEIQQARGSKPLPITQLKAARVPRRFISLIVSMLAIEPAARPAGARELSARLQAIRASILGRGKFAARLAITGAIVTLATIVGFRVSNSVRVKAIPLAISEKSIAVLPFENLSEDPGNSYFADGIQEEVLTRLANIADLKVISRTSTQRYHSKPGNLAEIAKQLGVANILEGSVQKAADQVRVTVQLINAQTDSHLWAETYDRKLTDILGVESEIAKGIAGSLQAKLSGREEQALAVKPTNIPEAYDAYLRGLAFEERTYGTAYSHDVLGKVAGFYERAVQLDPNFAIAWARLSRVNARSYFQDDHIAARREAAGRALNSAQKLEPNSPNTLLTLGYYQYYVLRDYAAATITFKRVRNILPGSSEVPMALGRVARKAGDWDDSIGFFGQALAFDPRNVELLVDTAWTYAILRQFPAALKLYDRALDVTQNDPYVMAAKASIYQAQGNLEESARLLSRISAQDLFGGLTLQIKFRQLILERNYGELIRLAQVQLTQTDDQTIKAIMQVWIGLTQRLAGDMAGANVTGEAARNTLEQLYREQTDDAGRAYCAAMLSNAYAAMGQKETALKAAERAIILQPRAKEAADGPGYEENQALIQAMFGENGRAIATLTQLLHTPYRSYVYEVVPVTPALLRLDPFWDSLRDDPAFQKLCEEKIDRSIAVLPFENLSNDPNNAYFAEGIQEEILTRLAGVADLKVISRPSTQHYQSKPGNLAEIAKQLGVANILEGSVQKAADQVRVNVQLINAQTDSHLWADSYDRKLTDILGVESEIAKGIAGSLQAKLTGREEQALAVKPTNNPEAYDAYLRGMAFAARSVVSHSDDILGNAIGFFDRAVQLDPNFAVAWARLSRAHAQLCANGVARRDATKHALENAQRLEPNSPETLLALGYYQYSALRDYGAANTTFDRVRKMLPNSSEAPSALAFVARREGQWDQSIAYFEEALTLDPRNVGVLINSAAVTYAMLRQFPAALKLYDRALDIVPTDPDLMAAKASIYQAEGSLLEAAKFLSDINWQSSSSYAFETKIAQLRLERNYGEAVRLLQARQAQFHFDFQSDKRDNLLMLAMTQRLAGDAAGAKVTAEQARNMIEPLYRNQPDNWALLRTLAVACALVGQKDLAAKEAGRAIMLLPRVKDAVFGPTSEENLALIQTMLGDNSDAISTLTRLLQTPYMSWLYNPAPITPALLRIDPLWDSLRGDPAFQKLCKGQEK